MKNLASRHIAPVLMAVALTSCASSNAPSSDDHGAHVDTVHVVTPAGNAGATGVAGATGAQDMSLPADAATARARLEASPRHGEYQMIRTSTGDSIRAWVVYPERSTKAPVVLVVHEIYGLTTWVRAVADQLAADGFIAIAPDLLTPKNVAVDSVGDPVPNAATTAIRTLDRTAVHTQLRDIASWGMSLPAATQKYGIVGFCWGGGASLDHAMSAPDLHASVIYYGSPALTNYAAIRAPVLGLYGGADARVNATIPTTDSIMKSLGKTFEPHIFEGAGHGFARQQSGQNGANAAAIRQAWPLTVAWFRRHLEG